MATNYPDVAGDTEKEDCRRTKGVGGVVGMKVVISRVDDIADQIRGVTYRKQDAATSKMNGFLPVLRAGNITDQGLTYEDLVYVPASKISEKQKIRKHDVLIAASSGSLDVVGKAAPALEDFEGGFGAFCKVLRPHKNVDPAYFAQFFKTPEYRRTVSSLAAGANINNLRNEDLDGLQIPLPPLGEQKRIAAILDAADALRAKRRETLAQLDTLLQSTFLDMFGDPVTNPKGLPLKNLGDVCDVRDGTHDSPKYLELGHPLLTSKNFKNGKIDFNGASLISEEDFHQINKRSKVDIGDLVMPMIGTIGNPVLVERDPIFAIKNVALIKFHNGSPDNRFVRQLLCSNYFDHVTAKANRGGTQKFVALKDLRKMPIPLPSIDLQKKFTTIVESIEQQKTRLRAHLTELDTLFASLQDRAFKGAL
jgi:type I restriction enzyme S subunit